MTIQEVKNMGEDELREFLFYREGEEIPEEVRNVLDPESRIRKISAKGKSAEDLDVNTRENYLSKVEEKAQELNADIVKELDYQQKTRGKPIGTLEEMIPRDIFEAVGTGVIRIYKLKALPIEEE